MSGNPFYDDMYQTASELLEEFGGPVTVRDKGISNHDPIEGTVDENPVNVLANGVFVSITDENRPEGEVRDGDKWVFTDKAVALGNLIVTGSDEWEVVHVKTVQPDPISVVVIWQAQVRK